ncbi:MAG: 3-methyl-2-oxobutanoate hydroxymethyltransferase [Alphaproteobacteria bacterium]|nr:3-methyl-2-oxobutanoate hydroxymethyltransferase [Alphaproteobacteria bacterium]
MSANSSSTAFSVIDFTRRKGGDPLAGVAAYTTPIAKLADNHCEFILVGDSVGMVMHGFSSTLEVTMDMMIMHGRAVRKGVKKALMIVDMPFGSYEENKEQAFHNARIIMQKTRCEAVKLEGGVHMAETISFLASRGIPVMAHIGLTPQSVNMLGGYSVQGRGKDRERILEDAIAVADAGAFSVVLEMLTESIASEVTKRINIPTIGIGASVMCDGQVLVVDDLLGIFNDFKPKFVKHYEKLGTAADKAISEYALEVRARKFPSSEHVFEESNSINKEGKK